MRIILRFDLRMRQQRGAPNIAWLREGDDRAIAFGAVCGFQDRAPEFADRFIAGLVLQNHLTLDGDIVPPLVAVIDLGGDGQPLFIRCRGATDR